MNPYLKSNTSVPGREPEPTPWWIYLLSALPVAIGILLHYIF